MTWINWRKFVKTWLVDHPLCLQGMLWRTRFSFAIWQTYAKVLSELMLVSLILSLCVRHCQLVCTRAGRWIRNVANLNRLKTWQGFMKTWWCHTFSESDHSVKWKVSTRKVYRKKWCIQFWWPLWTLQYCFWSYWMLFSFSSMSKSLCISHWGRNSTRH